MKKRQHGTGQWFLDAPEVADLYNGSNPTLFCPGITGAGKTVIAAIAIDHLLKSTHRSSHGIAYVYCNYKEEQDTIHMLAAILKQLAQSDMQPLQRLHNRHAKSKTKLSLDEICSTLEDVLTDYTTISIVIDALDECQDGTRRQFLAKFGDLQTGHDVRLMATSQFIPEIVDSFQRALQVEVRATAADVQRFVVGQMHRLPRCIQHDITQQLPFYALRF